MFFMAPEGFSFSNEGSIDSLISKPTDPNFVVKFGKAMNGSELTVKELSKINRIFVYIENSGATAISIRGFKVTSVRRKSNGHLKIVQSFSESKDVSPEMKKLLKRAEPGERIYIEQVWVEMDGKSFVTKPISITVI